MNSPKEDGPYNSVTISYMRYTPCCKRCKMVVATLRQIGLGMSVLVAWLKGAQFV